MSVAVTILLTLKVILKTYILNRYINTDTHIYPGDQESGRARVFHRLSGPPPPPTTTENLRFHLQLRVRRFGLQFGQALAQTQLAGPVLSSE